MQLYIHTSWVVLCLKNVYSSENSDSNNKSAFAKKEKRLLLSYSQLVQDVWGQDSKMNKSNRKNFQK